MAADLMCPAKTLLFLTFAMSFRYYAEFLWMF